PDQDVHDESDVRESARVNSQKATSNPRAVYSGPDTVAVMAQVTHPEAPDRDSYRTLASFKTAEA
ncbi:MAG TPA: hypothetical protein VIL33_07235, partial [Rhodothermia bacterium]